jgi:hypothetical protein
MTQLLSNPSFEDGWTTIQYGNQQPNGWVLTWLSNGVPMLSTGAFPGDDAPVFETVATWPECVHKFGAPVPGGLPPHEWLGGEHALVLDGVATYKIFGTKCSATMWQSLEVPPLVSAVLRVPVQVHYQADGSYGACAFRIRANEYATQWVTFSGGLPDPADPYFVPVELAFTTPADGLVTVAIDCEVRAESPVSFFLDALSLEVADAPDDETDEDGDGSWDGDGDIETFPPAAGEIPPPAPPASYDYPVIDTGSKLCTHGIGESGSFDLLAETAYHGAPLGFAKVVAPQHPSELQAAVNLKALSPTTRMVARMMRVPSGFNIEGPDFNASPERYMAEFLPVMATYPTIDYWELWNEQNPPYIHVTMANFAIGCMQIARAHGVKLAVMSYSTGVPMFERWQDILSETRFFQECIEGGHILSLHAYCQTSDPSSMVKNLFHHERLYHELLIPAGMVVPYLWTEYAPPTETASWKTPALMAEFAAVDAIMAGQFYCLGACLYTFGGRFGWPQYNLDPRWRDIADLVIATRSRKNATP